MALDLGKCVLKLMRLQLCLYTGVPCHSPNEAYTGTGDIH